MRVSKLDLSRTHPYPLTLHVEGGGPAEWHVHDDAFSEAVLDSLVASRAFTAIVERDGADYRLDAVLGDLRQPVGGLNEPTMMTVLWSLSRVDTRETVWQQLVRSTGTSVNFVGAWRIRNAAEEAAQNNIRQALRLLAEAELLD
jgi:hypothetical protein